MIMTDLELLRAFAESGSEEAFGEIVRRYGGLVYSARAAAGGGWGVAEDVPEGTQCLSLAILLAGSGRLGLMWGVCGGRW